MTEHAPDRAWAGIDIPKTIAGVLATVSAAVVGSFLGVAGTLIGAALASVVGTVGTELYHGWIDKGARKLKTTLVAAPAAVGTPSVAAAKEEVPSEPEPTTLAPRIRWGRVGLLASAVFILAIGTLSVFELVTGKSAADAVGNKSSSNTTVCSLLCSDKNKTPSPPATSGSTKPSGATKPADGPTDAPTSAAPGGNAPTTESNNPPATDQPAPGATTPPANAPAVQGTE